MRTAMRRFQCVWTYPDHDLMGCMISSFILIDFPHMNQKVVWNPPASNSIKQHNILQIYTLWMKMRQNLSQCRFSIIQIWMIESGCQLFVDKRWLEERARGSWSLLNYRCIMGSTWTWIFCTHELKHEGIWNHLKRMWGLILRVGSMIPEATSSV